MKNNPSEPQNDSAQDRLSPSERLKAGRRAGTVGIIFNFFLCALKAACGILAHSVAVIADAANNLSDAGSSVITAVSFRLSGRPADKKHPFGHARIEYISALVVSFIVTLLGVELFKSSVDAIIHPEEPQFSYITLIALLLSIAVKAFMAFYFKKVGKKINSMSLIASAADSAGDMLSTAAVIAGIIIHIVYKKAAGKAPAVPIDGILGAGVALFILFSGIKLIKETADPLLGAAPDPELVKYVSRKVLSYDHIIGVHDLVIHDYGQGRCFATAHAEVPASRDVMKSHDTIDNIENDFLQQDSIHLVLHLDPVENDNPDVCRLRDITRECAGRVFREQNRTSDYSLSIHDFRAVFGDTHINIIFDISIPIDYSLTDEQICEMLAKEISAENPCPGKKLNTVITVDRSYDRTVNEISA